MTSAVLRMTSASLGSGGATPPHALARGVWSAVKGVFVGSGSDGMGAVAVRDAVIRLSGKSRPSVLYIGTPTYDLPEPQAKQTAAFAALGCDINALRLTSDPPKGHSIEEAAALISAADVILVSGGNPLFAVARWEGLGIVALLQEAMASGKVMCGGSCGLISWFDAGHSDSADPASYYNAMVTPQASGSTLDAAAASSWEYVRVPCLGFLPGLICPHHDRVQSNGILRATDFDQMLLRHPGERGLAVDHFCALVISDDTFTVLPIPDQPGSVGATGSFVSDGTGSPGIWIKEVVDGAVVATLLPRTGPLTELLQPATEVMEDPRIPGLRLANPAF